MDDRSNPFRFLSILLTLLVCLPILALDPEKKISQYIHDSWGLEDNLPQTSVQAIVQTEDGYLWLATQEGLVRFDGYNMTTFNHQPQFNVRLGNVSYLFEDSSHKLWIATRTGLFSYKDEVFVSYEDQPNAPNGRVLTITESLDGVIWIGSDHGLFSYKDGVFNQLTTEDGLASNIIPALFSDREGKLWLGSDAGLMTLEGDEIITFTTDIGMLSNKVLTLFQSRDDAIWLGSDKGLSRFKEGRFTHYREEDGLISSYVQYLYEDRDGILWVGTASGLSRIWQGEVLNEGLQPIGSQVNAIFEDREQNLWVGTWSNGLHRFRNGIFTCYGSLEGMPDDLTRSVVMDKESNGLWIGTGKGIAHMTDGKVDRVIDKENGLINNVIYTLLTDSKGGLWVGSRFGGISYITDEGINNYTTDQGLSDNNIRSIVEARDGVIWIATYGGGVDVLENDRFNNISAQDGLSSDLVFSLFQDRQDRMWIGTAGQGLNIMENGQINVVDVSEGLSGNAIYDFYEDDTGDIWIGTNAGVTRYRNGRFQSITEEDGLFDNIAYSVTEDDYGRLWFSCNRGIYSVSKRVLNEYLDKGQGELTYKAYDMSNGMRGSECNYGGVASVVKTDDGSLWFPTVNSIARINPVTQKINRMAPPVHIVSVTTTNEQIKTENGVHYFEPGLQNMEIHYTGLSFQDPSKVFFRYKLEGEDNQYIHAGTRRTAFYNNLPHGTYRFHVIACNNDGVWNDVGATYSFNIKAHYYETIWFYTLCILAALSLSAAIYRIRLRRHVARERQLQKVVASRTQALVGANKELLEAQEKLVQAAHQAGMAEVATNVLHDIGNALNSVNVTSSTISRSLDEMKIDFLVRLSRLIEDNRENLAQFITEDPRGQRIPDALKKVSTKLVEDQNHLSERVRMLDLQILRLNDIIRAQQSHAERVGAYYEATDFNRFLNDQLENQGFTLNRRAKLERDYEPLPEVQVQKAKLKQVLLHILNNAFEAVEDDRVKNPVVRISTQLKGNDLMVSISDNGLGIEADHLERIYFHGFTTKDGRDGFGLHYCANAVKEMHGELFIHSDGSGKGSTVQLVLPIRGVEISESSFTEMFQSKDPNQVHAGQSV